MNKSYGHLSVTSCWVESLNHPTQADIIHQHSEGSSAACVSPEQILHRHDIQRHGHYGIDFPEISRVDFSASFAGNCVTSLLLSTDLWLCGVEPATQPEQLPTEPKLSQATDAQPPSNPSAEISTWAEQSKKAQPRSKTWFAPRPGKATVAVQKGGTVQGVQVLK